MKKILNILITIILLGTLVACQEEVSFMQVSSDKEYYLTTKGGKIDINVNASERPISTGMSTWLHTKITDHGPQEYVVTIIADRNLSGKERKAEAVIRVNDELRELITIHQEYRKDSLATNESVFECLPEVTQMTIEYSSTLPIDSLILLCEAPFVKATLAENRIELSLDLNISLEDRSFDVVLTTADEYVNTLKWTINQRATVRNSDGMVQFDDAAFKKAVLEMHDTDGDGDLSIEEAEAIEHLDVSGKDIRNLNGVEPMRNLRSLDFRDNPKLCNVYLDETQTSQYDLKSAISVDLSNPHPYLTDIKISNGVSLDISGCPYFVWIEGYEKDMLNKGVTQLESNRTYINNLNLAGVQVAILEKYLTFDTYSNHRTYKPFSDEYSSGAASYQRIKTYKKSVDKSRHGEIVKIFEHTKGTGIPLNITIKGLIDTDLETEIDEFLISNIIDNLFSYEPFRSHKEYFDINYIINVYDQRNYFFENNNGVIQWEYNPEVFEHHKEIDDLCNVKIYCGSIRSGVDREKQIMLSQDQCITNKDHTFTHECGHLIGKLADEYTYNFTSNSDDEYPPATVSFSGKVNVSKTSEPELVPWSRFLTHPDYKYKVGIYEGAAQYKKGVWKSTTQGMMLDNDQDNQFSAVSRWGIFRQIMIRSGEWRKAFVTESENDIKEFKTWFINDYDPNDNYKPNFDYWKSIEERMTKTFEDWCFEEFVKYDVINKDIPY